MWPFCGLRNMQQFWPWDHILIRLNWWAIVNHSHCSFKCQNKKVRCKTQKEVKVKILEFLEDITWALPIVLPIKPNNLSFECIVQHHCNTCLLVFNHNYMPCLTPFKCRSMHKPSVQLRPAYVTSKFILSVTSPKVGGPYYGCFRLNIQPWDWFDP